MKNIGEEIGLQHFNAPQFFHHLVEIQDHRIQVIQLAHAVQRRDIHRKIAICHFFGGIAQIAHRLFVIPADLPPGEEGEPHCHQAPVQGGQQDLHGCGPLLLIGQGDDANVDPGHQKERQQENEEDGNGETAGPNGLLPGLLAFHRSTALYPRPRTVLISNPLQAENLSRSLVMYTSTARRLVSDSMPQNSSINCAREKVLLG